MKTKNFFKLRSKLSSTNVLFFAVELDLVIDENGNEISDHSKLIHGQYEGIDFPVVFKQKRKGKFNDVLDTGWPKLLLISENLKKILEDNGLTGWKIFPIKLFDLNGNEISGYYGFSIVGHCGPVSYAQSKIMEKRMVPHGPLFQYFKGISFDRWDGSDFFIPDKTGYLFVTKKAADIFKKNKISNVSLVNLADIETDVDIVKNYNDDT